MRSLGPALLVCLASVVHAAPDLMPEIYEVTIETDANVDAGDVAEGCATETAHRTLVRFGVRAYNVGTDVLHRGAPGCPDCRRNPGASCQNPDFVCSPAGGHNHPHYDGFAAYELVDDAGNVVARGAKRSFCLLDSSCTSGISPAFFDCEVDQGISAGCRDDYRPNLGCQYVDATDLPVDLLPALRLRVTIDPENRLGDGDRSNNVVTVSLARCGDGVRNGDEECDAGPAGDDCCTSECRARSDGTACDTDATACWTASCAAGQCLRRPPAGSCLIDDRCIAAGTTDPGDDCRLCDPTQASDGWSRNFTPNATGLRCQTNRLTADMVALVCRPRLRRTILRRLNDATTRVDRLVAAPSARRRTRLVRRLEKLDRMLSRRATKGGCQTATLREGVETLLRQLRGLAILN